ncbi:hypothetical protein FGG08_004049, partial [Glutinoglossum americanum]
YACSPDECEKAPKLQPIQTWGDSIFSNETSFYILQDHYFNLNPVDFGLDFSIFVKYVSTPLFPIHSNNQLKNPIPTDAPNLEAQNLGKVPNLCEPGGAFAQGVDGCYQCMGYQNNDNGASFGRVVQPVVQQFLGYCGTAVSSPISIGPALIPPGSTAPGVPPSSHPIAIPDSTLSYPPGAVQSSYPPGKPPTTYPPGQPNTMPTQYSYAPASTVPERTVSGVVIPPTVIPAHQVTDSPGYSLIISGSAISLDTATGIGSWILSGLGGLSSLDSATSTSSGSASSDSTKTKSTTTTTTTTTKSTSTGSSSSSSSSRSSGASAAATAGSAAPRVSSAPWNIALVVFAFAYSIIFWS